MSIGYDRTRNIITYADRRPPYGGSAGRRALMPLIGSMVVRSKFKKLFFYLGPAPHPSPLTYKSSHFHLLTLNLVVVQNRTKIDKFFQQMKHIDIIIFNILYNIINQYKIRKLSLLFSSSEKPVTAVLVHSCSK